MSGPDTHDDDFAFEPVPGLPSDLPEGEEILWQGTPAWRPLAKRAFAIRWVAGFFALVAVFAVYALAIGEATVVQTLVRMATMAISGAIAVAVFAFLGWLIAINTIYTITNRRIVIRHGVTLPTALNVPFEQIRSANLVTFPDGTGEIRFSMMPKARLSLFVLWPHAKPWELTDPEPALKALTEPKTIAAIVGQALAAAAGPQTAGQSVPETSSRPQIVAGLPAAGTYAPAE